MTKRLWPVAILAGVAVVSIAGAAYACRCAIYKSAADQLAAVDVMFVGRVQDSQPEPGRLAGLRRNATTFTVLRTLKGEVPPTAEVLHEPSRSGPCGVSFKPGDTRIVLAHRDAEGALETSGCDAPQYLLADYQAAR